MSNLFQIDHPQDWLVKAPPLSPFLSKYIYENEFSLFAKLVDMYLMNDEKEVFARFENLIRHDSRHENDDYIKKKIKKKI